MRKSLKRIIYLAVICLVVMPCMIFFTGCFETKSIVSFEKTGTEGLVDTYTITYSDGSTETFTVTNGQNGTNGVNGENGKDGKDGSNVTVEEIYSKYVEEYGELTYSEFLEKFLNFESTDNSITINECLQSVMKVHCEFKTSSTSWGTKTYDKAISSGSAVIYEINEVYTYIVTNYHVVFNKDASTENGGKIASKITGYLYGSEGNVYKNSSKVDSEGYPVISYNDNYAISLEYVGGTITYDIAVIRAKTEDLKKINENFEAVKLADEYFVGETAIAIGNTENEGISVTEGIVSVDNEDITLDIDGTEREYRSLRIDTAIYSGNSGGGLFNSEGRLIGITNAGDSEDQNVNYAIPVQIVRAIYNNIMHYYLDGNAFTNNAYKIKLGVTVELTNSKYTYDKESGYGKITEDVVVNKLEEDSIVMSLGLAVGDKIISLIINGKEYIVERSFEIGDAILEIISGDTVKIKYIRNDVEVTTDGYVIADNDLNAIE